MYSDIDSATFDVIIVGAGPSGLSAAIRLKQKAQIERIDLSICVLEKGSEVGAHILSGAVIEPHVLNQLFPDWMSLGAPLLTRVRKDRFLYLTENKSYSLPIPPQMNNSGNYIISLGKLCRWLGKQAEALDVEIYPGFSATKVLYNSDGSVKGVATGDMGVDKNGEHTPNYQPGMELHGKQTIFSEGCRGSLTKTLLKQFDLDSDAEHQVYGLGIKELWEVPKNVFCEGEVLHTIGWPIPNDVYGGSFLYHLDDNLISIGLVIGLDYKNTWLSPYEMFQQFKTHPAIRSILERGRRISYGARTLTEGGFQSLPKLSFPGGVLVGDAAGFLNVAKVKGTHMAMQSGITAADSVFNYLKNSEEININEIVNYTQDLKDTWLWDELYRARNIKPSFKWGLWAGLSYSAVDTLLFKGKAPWTLRHKVSIIGLQKKNQCKKISYPKHDEQLTFDRLSSVYFSNISHNDNQPCHLELKDKCVPMSVNYALYSSPEVRYCPAGVYEVVEDVFAKPSLQINAQNCLHCKACDIKDPTQNINWLTPEGGSGPNYSIM